MHAVQYSPLSASVRRGSPPSSSSRSSSCSWRLRSFADCERQSLAPRFARSCCCGCSPRSSALDPAPPASRLRRAPTSPPDLDPGCRSGNLPLPSQLSVSNFSRVCEVVLIEQRKSQYNTTGVAKTRILILGHKSILFHTEHGTDHRRMPEVTFTSTVR